MLACMKGCRWAIGGVCLDGLWVRGRLRFTRTGVLILFTLFLVILMVVFGPRCRGIRVWFTILYGLIVMGLVGLMIVITLTVCRVVMISRVCRITVGGRWIVGWVVMGFT